MHWFCKAPSKSLLATHPDAHRLPTRLAALPSGGCVFTPEEPNQPRKGEYRPRSEAGQFRVPKRPGIRCLLSCAGLDGVRVRGYGGGRSAHGGWLHSTHCTPASSSTIASTRNVSAPLNSEVSWTCRERYARPTTQRSIRHPYPPGEPHPPPATRDQDPSIHRTVGQQGHNAQAMRFPRGLSRNNTHPLNQTHKENILGWGEEKRHIEPNNDRSIGSPKQKLSSHPAVMRTLRDGDEMGGSYGRQERESPETSVSVAGHRAGMVESEDQRPAWPGSDPCRQQ